MAENVSNSIDKSPIGVDYDREKEPILSTEWIAKWFGAPPLPPWDGRGADLDWARIQQPPQIFLSFYKSFPRTVP